jgi:hypothetical protein
MNVAILVPVCSRNQTYSSFEEIPFLKYLYPSFEKTKEDGYNYTFFIGYDDDDEFYTNNSQLFGHTSYRLEGCQHAPATAWNKLAEIAFNSETKYDYFFQIGDDVVLETLNWTTTFIRKLNQNNDIGVVGPCHLNNYNGRILQGRPYVIENAFVSRKHLEIFGYFFHPSIKNWFCDDWITQIYKNTFSEIQTEYMCYNSVMDRYAIVGCHNISALIEEGSLQISKYINNRRCFSYCVFGNQKKYCQGMIRNLEQIQEMFPDYKVIIYLGNDVPQEYIDKYRTFNNVNLIQRDFTGLLITIHRYLALDDNYDVVFVRDADSRFGDRDIWCINHFLTSEYKVFTIRDHYYQMRVLMAGQTGIKNIPDISIEKKLIEFMNEKPNINYYQNDQDFIEKYIFNSHKQETIAYVGYHSFGEKTTMQIPVPRKSDEDFCGNVYLFDGDEEYVQFTLHGEKSR